MFLRNSDDVKIDNIIVNITRTGHVSSADAERLASYISRLRENRKPPPIR